MEPKTAAASKALEVAKAAAGKSPDRIQSVKVKIKFGDKMAAVKKKANSFGASQKFGKI
jgi:hypothetical protein